MNQRKQKPKQHLLLKLESNLVRLLFELTAVVRSRYMLSTSTYPLGVPSQKKNTPERIMLEPYQKASSTTMRIRFVMIMATVR